MVDLMNMDKRILIIGIVIVIFAILFIVRHQYQASLNFPPPPPSTQAQSLSQLVNISQGSDSFSSSFNQTIPDSP